MITLILLHFFWWGCAEIETSIKSCYPSTKYILISDGQLVGAAILLFAKADLSQFIRDVQISIAKTGLGGMAGNKGAISASMQIFDSSICFVTAHLAAGHSNVEERNRDYHTITSGTLFKRGRKISDHDLTIWLGDFNYRIEIDNPTTRSLISQGRFAELFLKDQLSIQKLANRVFSGFHEGIIEFAPTYRFEVGTDHYDESDRVPAWTDRVLFRPKEKFKLISYARAELRGSDHRPVRAIFHARVTFIDHEIRKSIRDNLLINLRNPFRNLMINQSSVLLALDELPKPSTEQSQWWSSVNQPVSTEKLGMRQTFSLLD
jgi:endonuclease/exonuclease/phosphatase family metal-dependent hydrolase